MKWVLSHRFDHASQKIADRHYNRQKPGTPQFVPPGRCIVLITECAQALWVTSWPFEEYTKHEWAGAWVNTLFRNEGAGLSSDLITQAVAATVAFWQPPPLGIVTFVDRQKVRKKRDPGRCYRKAGWEVAGETKVNKLLCLQLLPCNMPVAELPLGGNHELAL